jgi:hypothetical protein
VFSAVTVGCNKDTRESERKGAWILDGKHFPLILLAFAVLPPPLPSLILANPGILLKLHGLSRMLQTTLEIGLLDW